MYSINIVKNTREQLSHDHQVATEGGLAILLSRVLGLLAAVSERKEKTFDWDFYEDRDKEFISCIPESIGFFRSGSVQVRGILKGLPVETPRLLGKEYVVKEKNKSWLVTKLRKAIEQQCVAAIGEGEAEKNKWTKVRLWTELVDGVVDFEIHLSTNELKKLAIKIADDYLFPPKFKEPIDYK